MTKVDEAHLIISGAISSMFMMSFERNTASVCCRIYERTSLSYGYKLVFVHVRDESNTNENELPAGRMLIINVYRSYWLAYSPFPILSRTDIANQLSYYTQLPLPEEKQIIKSLLFATF